MIKLSDAILRSLRNNNGLKAIEGLDFLIPNVTVYLVYSMKFEINRSKFKSHAEDYLSGFFDNPNKLWDYLNILQNWYESYLDNKVLAQGDRSLKGDTKKWYKKNVDASLKGFDRFFEACLKAINEAFNIYTVVLYEPNAIKYNYDFKDDRGSCYINGRRDYLEALKQANSFYTIIYKNAKALTRIWLLVDEYYEGLVVFNPYGYKFKSLYKFFFNSEEDFYDGSPDRLEDAIGVYVNNDEVLISENLEHEDFSYDLECPNCGCIVNSSELRWIDGDGLRCGGCNGLVYSDYYGQYISEDDAYYSEVYESYIYYDDSVYSTFYDDRVLENDSRRVYNIDIDDYDYVLEEDCVYSDYYDMYLIKEQVVFSDYYNTYLLRDSVNTVFSKWLDSFIDIEDDNIVIINDDYILLEDIQEYIERNNIKHLKTV